MYRLLEPRERGCGQREEMTLLPGFGPNPANFFSCEESYRGQPDILHEQRLICDLASCSNYA